jgi:hypothetical protein
MFRAPPPSQFRYANAGIVGFDVFTAVTMKNAVFWDVKNPVRTSQETRYVSGTESSRLMLCKI